MVEAIWKKGCTVVIEQAIYRALDSRSFQRLMTHPELSLSFVYHNRSNVSITSQKLLILLSQ
jgi:hypothetical protein